MGKDCIAQHHATKTSGGGRNRTRNGPSSTEVVHYTWQWLTFCGIILLIYLYYHLVGRRRFFGNNALHRGIFDKMLNQFALVAFVGPFIWFARIAMDSSFFSDRIWRYLWLVWLAIIVVYWAYYFMFKYKEQRDQYRAYHVKQRYIPQPKNKRSARAGTR